MDNENLSIGKVLRKLREESGLSQEKLAYHCNIDRRYIYNLEYDTNKPGFELLIKLAWAFQMKPDELMKAIQEQIDLREVITDFNEE